MLKYSANNQTFHRSKVEYLNWLGRQYLKITGIDLGSDPKKDIEEVRAVLRDDQNDLREQE